MLLYVLVAHHRSLVTIASVRYNFQAGLSNVIVSTYIACNDCAGALFLA